MKKTTGLTIFLLLVSLFSFSQTQVELIFTAVEINTYKQLDSISIINKTHPGDTVLYWNDTVLSFLWTGFQEKGQQEKHFSICCSPNPVKEYATIQVEIPEQGNLYLCITDITGRSLNSMNIDLNTGLHSFQFMPGSEDLYLLSAVFNNKRKSIKLLNSSANRRHCEIKYSGFSGETELTIRSSEFQNFFLFEPGDELLLKGYADGLESALNDAPDNTEIYVFQFAYNTPCPEIPIVTYQGTDYNTVQIFNQCWLEKNLNAGVQINKEIPQTDNGIMERYCLYDELDNCDKYGGLYTWNEMMGYATQNGTQGICPDGWHVATLEEFKILEGSADSYYPVGDPEWDLYWTNRGTDVGRNLKTNKGWTNEGHGIDLFGFSALPAGQWDGDSFFGWEGRAANFWTSTEFYVPQCGWYINMFTGSDQDALSNHFKKWGFSVRCIKD